MNDMKKIVWRFVLPRQAQNGAIQIGEGSKKKKRVFMSTTEQGITSGLTIWTKGQKLATRVARDGAKAPLLASDGPGRVN